MDSIFLNNYPVSHVTEANRLSSKICEKIGRKINFPKNRKISKINDSAKQNWLKMWIIEIFSVFVHQFFRCSSFPGFKTTHLEKTSTGTCRRVIPRLREHQKEELVLNFLHVPTLFFPKVQCSIISSRSQSEILSKNRVFL